VVGQLHQPRLAATLGTGEGAGGITEELAFGQVFRKCSAVEGQKRRAKAITDGMAGAGHQFLASTGFTLDQQGRVQRGHTLCAGFKRANRRRLAEQGIKAFGMVVVQRGQALADTARLIQGQQGPRIGDRRGIEHQRMAVECDFAQWQAKAVFQQHVEQSGVGEQLADAFAGRFMAVQGHQCRVGQQHMALAVQRQYRIGHGREQGVELQVAALAGKDVDHCHRLHALDAEQGFAQFVEYLRAQGRGIDVDVGRDHLHRIQVEVTPAEQGQDFLGDADTVDKTDMDTHGNKEHFWPAGMASMPWRGG